MRAAQSGRLHTQFAQKLIQKDRAAHCLNVARDVMAIARMAACNQNSVSPTLKCFDDVARVYHSGTKNPDNANVGLLNESARYQRHRLPRTSTNCIETR